jgi:hypothetical protein
MGYLIKKTAIEIITAKVTLTSADLLTPGFIYNIPEYPKVAGYFWNVLYMNGEIVNGTTPYAGNGAIHIQSANAPTLQLRFTGTYMQNAVGTWSEAQNNFGTAGTKYATDDQLQIHNPGTLTLGDTELNIYIGANLIQY